MPQLTQVVRLNDDKGRGVLALTSVDSRRLFVLHAPSEQHIDVYETTTLELQQRLKVAGLGYIRSDLTSCVVNNCLYVSDFYTAMIFKVELTGDNQVLKWRVEGGSKPTGLSTNTACNLLVSCYNKLLEYTSSGSLVREIVLESMMNPYHAIQLTSDQFVVCTSDDVRVSSPR
jgi:hypothetical protein